MQTNLRTRRQQQWLDAHEREEQTRAPDLFGWWITMRTTGRIASAVDDSLMGQLRAFNAVQIAPLPYDAA